ncbi:MAG: histidine--tRNA ligase [Candidatus Moraniibacteriota bacterium]|nr:MAG: histidine--tRNA ligase [Candidatus Moranbacteria bacterium]
MSMQSKSSSEKIGKKKASLPLKKEMTERVVKRRNNSSKKVNTSSLTKTVRGMRDILPEEYVYWNHVYRALEKVVRELGFRRIELPVIEFSQLYKRSLGEGTDVIEKELFEFITKGGDKVALRPEMTAGLVRAFLQNGMQVWPKPIKMYSCGSLFRYDRPQAGRYREHRQANFDVFGETDPIMDAQLIQAAYRTLTSLGLKKIRFFVNSLGNESDRKTYQKLLTVHFRSQKSGLCSDCLERLKKNPLRILDCKEEACHQIVLGAPQIIDHLSLESHKHFKFVLEYLDELEIPYEINPFLVRGLDYYNETVFEVYCEQEEGKASLSLGGGGRYDLLVSRIGGGEGVPAIGFGLGLDRIILEMRRQGTKIYQEPKPKVFLAQLGEMAKKKSLKLFEYLEKNGILLAESFGRGSLKAQLRQASKINAEITLILGQKEVLDQTLIVKDMRTGSQETVPQEKVVDFLKKFLKKTSK